MWVRLYVQPIEGLWAAVILADTVTLLAPRELKGVAFFGDTAEEPSWITESTVQ